MNKNANAGEENQGEPVIALRQNIEVRAYHLWLENGGGHGDHERHWLQAERELMEKAKLELEQRSGGRGGRKTGKPHKS